MRNYYILIVLLMAGVVGNGQQSSGEFFAGEMRGGTVRMIYWPDDWPEEMDGYFFRVFSDGNWRRLHSEMIQPEINRTNELKHLPVGKTSDGIKQRIDSKIIGGQLKELSHERFKMLIRDSVQTKSIQFFLFRDFDLLTFSGFGGVYPIISAIDSIAVEKVFGNKSVVGPTLALNSMQENDYSMDIKGKIAVKNEDATLTWTIPILEYDGWKVLNGFQIIRIQDADTLKLTSAPVWMNRKDDLGQLVFKDKTLIDTLSATYLIQPVTIFGTLGTPKILPYQAHASAPASTEKESEMKPIENLPSDNKEDMPLQAPRISVLPFDTEKQSVQFNINDYSESVEDDGYLIYQKIGEDSIWYQLSQIGIIRTRSFQVEVPLKSDVFYGIRQYKNGKISPFSNIIHLQPPPPNLPSPVITRIRKQNGKTWVEWAFPKDIEGIKGFRVIIDGEIVGEAGKEVRSLEVEGMGKMEVRGY